MADQKTWPGQDLDASDIQIGAVEIKDATTDNRAIVDAAGQVKVKVSEAALPTGAATEATLATLATEATAATLATEVTVATLATEATAATLATEATLSTLDGKVSACDTDDVKLGNPSQYAEQTFAQIEFQAGEGAYATERVLGTSPALASACIVTADKSNGADIYIGVTGSTSDTSYIAALGADESFVFPTWHGAAMDLGNFAIVASTATAKANVLSFEIVDPPPGP
jgi:hypothetical protein